jgi:ADP-ribosyl-[dinitrogen reductase] hydrolase
MNTAHSDRTRGCLLGLAIGDALGATNEFKTVEQVQRAAPVTALVGGGWLNLPAGEVTDDTQMTRCILESYAHGYSLEDVTQRFVAWLESNPPDVGILTRQALEQVRRGVSPRDAGRKAWEASGFASAGNGAIMRCAPTGFLRPHDREARVLETIEIARVTHFDARCVDSSVWLNAVIAALVNGDESVDALEIAAQEVRWARQHCDLPTQNADEDVLEWVKRAKTLSLGTLDTSGYTLATAQVAAWTLLYADSLEAGLIAVVNQGGDADTTGAVAGALLGARFGASSIPARWLEALLWREELEMLLERATRHVANATD